MPIIAPNGIRSNGPIPDSPKTGIKEPITKLRIKPPTIAISKTAITDAGLTSRFGIKNLFATKRNSPNAKYPVAQTESQTNGFSSPVQNPGSITGCSITASGADHK